LGFADDKTCGNMFMSGGAIYYTCITLKSRSWCHNRGNIEVQAAVNSATLATCSYWLPSSYWHRRSPLL